MKSIRLILSFFAVFWIILSGVYVLQEIIDMTTNKAMVNLLGSLGIASLAILIAMWGLEDFIKKKEKKNASS